MLRTGFHGSNDDMEKDYHYYDGQIVRVGDRVCVYGKHFGVVEEVVMPDTQQAKDTGCPNGYVSTSCINADTGRKDSRLWTPPDGEFWEDLELIERGNLKPKKFRFRFLECLVPIHPKSAPLGKIIGHTTII